MAGAWHRWAAAVLAGALLLPACTGGSDRAVTVLAAASLADAFEALATQYEQEAAPGVEVRLAVAGSQQLAAQVLAGTPADVFASADHHQMDRVAEAGLVAAAPEVFARTTLTIAVPDGNPGEVDGLDDLADPSTTVVLAAPEVPAGRYARQVLDRADVAVTPVSLEADVRSVLAKVALGEADAGIVYASDVVASEAGVEAVPIPADRNVVATYPVAVLQDAPNPTGAAAFVAFLRSEDARATLARFDFRTERSR